MAGDLRLVVALAEVDADALPLAGGKAAQLGAMLRGGLPVPPGFCVTTAAFRRGMDAALAAEIASAYQALGGGRVAVRSSATAEDLLDASFAGQQDTFLNVSGAEKVIESVRACWESLFTERAVAYRRARTIPEDSVAMAVVVQQMVAAEAAGVLFTLNPVTGAIDELVVEAAIGLGDQVVSSRVTPDRYRLRRRAPHEPIDTEGSSTAALLPRHLGELARLGLAAERLLGRAADIEWALAAGRIYLLQARSVTAAGPRLPVVHYGSRWNAEQSRGRLTVWSNLNVRETMPYPHTPLSWSFWNFLAFPSVAVLFGVYSPREDPQQAPSMGDLVDGRVYFNMNVFAGLWPMPPTAQVRLFRVLDAEAAEILAELFRSGELRPLRRKGNLRRSLRFLWYLRGTLRKSSPEFAWRQLRNCQEEVATYSRIDLRALTDEQILALARYFATENLPRSMDVLGAAFLAAPLILLLSRLVTRWGYAEQLPRLLSGLRNNPTMETALALWDLAERAGPGVRQAFAARPIAEVPGALADTADGREFLERMQEFLKAHGHRAAREFDFSCPRWRDDPTFVYEMVRNYLSHPADQPTPRQHYERQVREHEEANAQMERSLARQPMRRRLFRWLIRIVEDRLPLREAPKFYGLMGVGLVRDLYLEVGKRMVARGVLETPDDFFFLSIPELERFAEGKLDAAWIREHVSLRRREFAQHMRASPPLVVRSDGKPAGKPPAAGEVLRGTPVSWGTARGPARILMDPSDGALLHKGEILVAPFTDPGWTPLFLTAGGLVMEIGGVMSHGAVVAREYGLPAVVGVREATRLLRDGELVEVDGGTGEVRRLQAPPAKA
jgi:pyruvate,water dikinase